MCVSDNGRRAGGPQGDFEGCRGPAGEGWRAAQPGGSPKSVQVRNRDELLNSSTHSSAHYMIF